MKLRTHLYSDSPIKAVFLILSLSATALTVITFYGWLFLWSWESPLIYPVALVVASFALYLNRWWSYLFAAVLSPYVIFNLVPHMILEWKEYWYAGAGFGISLREALFPIAESLSAVLAVMVFCYAIFQLFHRRVALP